VVDFFKHVPVLLVIFRFAIAPLLLLDAWDGTTTSFFLAGYILAILSDIFDGIIARRLQVSTAQLRQADSWADILLFLCLALSTWRVYPQVLMNLRIPLLIAIAAQVFLFSLCLFKYRKLPSYHTYTAKSWGLTILAATIALFGFGYVPILWLAIVFCWLNSIEEILMTLLLPQWQCDVLSLYHALQLRKTLASEPNG
jgi:CDP-diacylglycerol--glycerol-3-phosphate 3-phosphatidyltransferase